MNCKSNSSENRQDGASSPGPSVPERATATISSKRTIPPCGAPIVLHDEDMETTETDRHPTSTLSDLSAQNGSSQRSWSARISSMPYLFGGSKYQLDALRWTLETIRSGTTHTRDEVALPTGSQKPLGDLVKTLYSTGLIQADSGTITLTNQAQLWLDAGDDSTLIEVFHTHIRFVGELLRALKDGARSTRALNDIANTEYGMDWSTLDQVRRRVTWLALAGCVRYRTQKDLVITDRGEQLLEHLELGAPERPTAPPPAPDVFPEPPAEIKALLDSLTPETLLSRNPVIGYIPGGASTGGVNQTLQSIVEAANPVVSKTDFISFVTKRFGISSSSYGALQTTLTSSGLIEQTAINTIEATSYAKSWLESSDPKNLVYIFHAHHRLVLEIIPMLEYANKVSSIKLAAAERYGIPKLSSNSIRHRLHLLEAAQFVTPLANFKYSATPLGKRAAELLPLSQPAESAEPEGAAPQQDSFADESSSTTSGVATAIAQTLHVAGRNSETSIALEQAVDSAFRFLGFETKHIGGSGDTDVVAKYWSRPGEMFTIIIDAKAARSGNVSEGSVSFDTLREHRQKNLADSVVLVGPGFDGKRLRERARQNDVRLLTTEDLAKIVLQHATTPLSVAHYKNIGDLGDSPDMTVDNSRELRAAKLALLREVVALLAQERTQADQYTNGALTAREIHLMSRDHTSSKSSPADINGVLDLLSNPLIDAIDVVDATKDRSATYFLTDSFESVAHKLASLAIVLRQPGRD